MRLNAPSALSAQRAGPAFTLIELLVVVALIAMLTAGLGVALRHPGESVSLPAAQTTLASLLHAARGRAALTQQNARLVVAADPADLEKYLSQLRVVHQDPDNPGNWLADGDGLGLPRGVYVVPSSAAAVPGNPSWPASRRSSALSSAAATLAIDGGATGSFYFVQFTSRGTTGGGNLVLTAGRVTVGAAGPALAFDNPDNVRGVLLRTSGALTLLNDASAFAP